MFASLSDDLSSVSEWNLGSFYRVHGCSCYHYNDYFCHQPADRNYTTLFLVDSVVPQFSWRKMGIYIYEEMPVKLEILLERKIVGIMK